ncbi:hypothetical protein Tco_1392387 [Tanacetum coccineum]
MKTLASNRFRPQRSKPDGSRKPTSLVRIEWRKNIWTRRTTARNQPRHRRKNSGSNHPGILRQTKDSNRIYLNEEGLKGSASAKT